MNPVSLFWLAALVLVVLTLVALAWPLLRQGSRTAPAEANAAHAVYRDHKRQLDDDLAAGTLTPAEHRAAIEDLVQRYGAEIAAEPGAVTPIRAGTPWPAVLILVAVIPAASFALYQMLGNPTALSQSAEATRPRFNEDEVRGLVERLAERMKSNPEDPNGWLLLARSYTAMGRYGESAAAYAEAAQRLPPTAQVLADWADSAAMAQGQTLAGKPEELVNRALALEPGNRKALALSATGRLERGDVAGALARWRELRQQLVAAHEDTRDVDAVIAEIDVKSGKVAASAPPPAGAASTAPDAPAAGKGGTTEAAADASAGAISGRVELDPKLAAAAGPDDVVFIVARGVDGMRIPLAVTRMRVRDLPAAFRLDDSMGMMPEFKLSAAKRVVVEGRVSKSGNALTRSGDLRGASEPVVPGARDLRIVIGETVP